MKNLHCMFHILVIDSTSIVQGKAFKQAYTSSPVDGINLIFYESSMDIICISADPFELFGILGIFDHYTIDEEVQAFFSFIDQSTSTSYSSTAGLELHSPDSEDQKSLRLSAKSIFGASQFEHRFFSSRPFGNFESLTLRNAGEDCLELECTELCLN
jgi:hypothetical protein